MVLVVPHKVTDLNLCCLPSDFDVAQAIRLAADGWLIARHEREAVVKDFISRRGHLLTSCIVETQHPTGTDIDGVQDDRHRISTAGQHCQRSLQRLWMPDGIIVVVGRAASGRQGVGARGRRAGHIGTQKFTRSRILVAGQHAVVIVVFDGVLMPLSVEHAEKKATAIIELEVRQNRLCCLSIRSREGA